MHSAVITSSVADII